MKKIFIWLLALGAGLIALLIAAVIIIPKVVDIETYLPAIEKKVTEVTGRPFSMGRDFEVSVFPWVGVLFSDLRMGNPEAFGGGDFITVESFETRVKLLPLLTKKIEIKKFVLKGPEIHLVKSAKGDGNWALGTQEVIKTAQETKTAQEEKAPSTKGSDTKGGAQLPVKSLQVDEFTISDGRVVYTDKGTDLQKEVDNISLKLEDVSLDRLISLNFKADVEGRPVSVTGSLGPVGKVPGQGRVAIDLVVKAFGQLEMALQGDVVDPATRQQFKMNLSLAPFSPRKLLQELDIAMPVETADVGVLDNFHAKLDVEGNPNDIQLRESSITLDDSVLNMSARIQDMARPDVAFNLDLDTFNLDRYLPPRTSTPPDTSTSPDTKTPPDTKTSKSSTEAKKAGPAEIDYTPLRRLLLDGEVHIGELVVHGAKVERAVFKIVGKNGVFILDPATFDLYQGSIGITGNFNVQKDTPTTKVDLKAADIQAGPLLKDSMEKDVIRGAMNAAASLSFRGDNAMQIKKSLNGAGELSFLDGAIVGIDIAEMARSFAKGGGQLSSKDKPKTDFAELRVPYTLNNGLFKTTESFLASPLLRVKAFGTANLVSEQLDMKVRPKIVGTLKGQGDAEKRSGLTVPIAIQGTFAKPEFSADLSAIANEETIMEAVQDPEAAKEKIREQVKSLEETGKTLEETGKGLLKNFGFGSKEE